MNLEVLQEFVLRAPTPVAKLAERAQNDCAPERQHHNTYYLWELWLSLATAVVVARHRQHGVRTESLDAAIRLLARPALGHLSQVIHAYRKVYPDDAFGRWWHNALDEFVVIGYHWTCEHAGLPTVARPTISTFAESLVAYRNRNLGHGALRDSDFYRDGAAALFASIGQSILDGTEALGGHFLVVEDVGESEAGTRLATVMQLRGIAKMRLTEPMTEKQLSGFRKGSVYFAGSDDQFVPVSPWLVWDRSFLLVLNGASASKVEYLNYYTGELARFGEPQLSAVKAVFSETPAEHPDQLETAPRSGRWVGPYEILAELGRGGMGAVYLARQESLGQRVALKVLPADFANDETAVARFAREAELLRRAEHPSIISTLEYGQDPDDGTHFYAMELVVGASLAELYDVFVALPVAEKHTLSELQVREGIRSIVEHGPLGKFADDASATRPSTGSRVEATVEVVHASSGREGGEYWRLMLLRFAEVADALSHLHAHGTVHRDIKPSNIMLTENASHAVVMDLGIAKTEAGTVRTRTGAFVGTLRYASREQVVRTLDELDFRADLYSLGATMYEMLTLKPLYADDEATARSIQDSALLRMILDDRPVPACERMPGLRPEIGIILGKLLEKQADRRFYTSAADLAADLRAVCDQRPIRAKEYTWEERRAFELYDSLRAQATTWNAERRPPDLLLGLERVDELERLGILEKFDLDLVQREFFDACLDAAEEERELQEQQRRREEDRRAKEQENRRLRLLLRRSAVTVVIVFLMVSSVAAFLSWRGVKAQWVESEKARRAAEAARAEAETNRAEAYVLKGRQAAGADAWDEAALHFAKALAITASSTRKTITDRAREGLDREAKVPVHTRLRWSASLPCTEPAVAFSRDGGRVATVCGSPMVYLLDAKGCGSAKAIRLERGQAFSVAYSPTDDKLAVGTDAGDVLVLDGSTADVRIKLGVSKPGEGRHVLALAFSPDGRTLLAGRQDGDLCAYDTTGSEVKERCFAGGGGAILDIAVSADGKTVAAACEDNALRVWGIDGKKREEQKNHAEPVFAVAYSNLGDLLLSGSGDNEIRAWERASWTTFGAHSGDVYTISVSGDGTLVASGGEDHTVRIWMRRSGSQLRVLGPYDEEVAGVSFSPDGTLLAAGIADGRVDLFEVSHTLDGSGEKRGLVSPLLGHSNGVEMIVFDRTSKKLASSADDGTVRMWDLERGVQTLVLKSDARARLAMSNDGSLLFVGTERYVQRWSASGAGVLLAQVEVGPAGMLSYDDRRGRVAFGLKDGRVGIWDGTSKKVRTWRAHDAPAFEVSFSQDGNTFASAGADGRALLWDVRQDEPRRTALTDGGDTAHHARVYEVAFSPDGALVATASQDGTVRMWNARTGGLLRKLEGGGGRVYGVAFAPDGKALATASKDGGVRTYEVATGKPMRALFPSLAAAYTTRYSPDGKWLAVSSEDRTIRLFDTQTWREVGWQDFEAETLETIQNRTGLGYEEGHVARSKPSCEIRDDSVVR